MRAASAFRLRKAGEWLRSYRQEKLRHMEQAISGTGFQNP
jgi:hypothetical protein